ETLKSIIEDEFENRQTLSPTSASYDLKIAIQTIIDMLDQGQFRIAEKIDGQWHTHEWLKKAVILSFRITPNMVMHDGCTQYYDKVPLKYQHYSEQQFLKDQVRVVPDAIVRKGAYIAPNTVLMPSYVNLGAHIESGTMIDTWATVGSCAQIGKNV